MYFRDSNVSIFFILFHFPRLPLFLLSYSSLSISIPPFHLFLLFLPLSQHFSSLSSFPLLSLLVFVYSPPSFIYFLLFFSPHFYPLSLFLSLLPSLPIPLSHFFPSSLSFSFFLSFHPTLPLSSYFTLVLFTLILLFCRFARVPAFRGVSRAASFTAEINIALVTFASPLSCRSA